MYSCNWLTLYVQNLKSYLHSEIHTSAKLVSSYLHASQNLYSCTGSFRTLVSLFFKNETRNSTAAHEECSVSFVTDILKPYCFFVFIKVFQSRQTCVSFSMRFVFTISYRKMSKMHIISSLLKRPLSTPQSPLSHVFHFRRFEYTYVVVVGVGGGRVIIPFQKKDAKKQKA